MRSDQNPCHIPLYWFVNIIIVPIELGSIIPYITQSTGVLITAQMLSPKCYGDMILMCASRLNDLMILFVLIYTLIN